MTTQSRIAYSLLAVVSCLITALPASAGLLFSNGPPSGAIYGWEIDSGLVVSDSFFLTGGATPTSFVVALWVLPGQMPTGLEWSITSREFSGTYYGIGTYAFTPADLTLLSLKGTTFIGDQLTMNTPCGTSGCDIYLATVNMTGVPNLFAGSYWLNLDNATATSGPVGWDENDGTNSLASESARGTIGSEDPDIYGTPNSPSPEPGSFVLFASGAAVLAGILRRRRKL